jgi:hypothetical protein
MFPPPDLLKCLILGQEEREEESVAGPQVVAVAFPEQERGR